MAEAPADTRRLERVFTRVSASRHDPWCLLSVPLSFYLSPALENSARRADRRIPGSVETRTNASTGNGNGNGNDDDDDDEQGNNNAVLER